ncbi:transposable element Tcb2 transposase [Trichonephila clavipes]|nr:transposable element Tcb2 transposase [Trichonephila clavipes]
MMWRIGEGLETGQCEVQICREFNLMPSVACNLWKQFQDIGFIKRKSGQSRPRATTAREDRHLSIIARRNRGATASKLFCYLYAATGTHVSMLTVSKRLYEGGLFAKSPASYALLTSMNRRVTLPWCRQHRDWSTDHLAIFLFIYESRFSLNIDFRRMFIWRKQGTHYLLSNVHEIDNNGGGSLIVWEGIILNGRSPQHVFERGTVTGLRSGCPMFLFSGASGPDIILMDDNVRPRRALLVDKF